ncbi:MAG: DUF3833 domain-containing protein [Roseateles depolymerans]|uniref:DUF3833 domain-containing protein n=1 Tax=Roseateles depolymerans TaxID=76731 RepID=A0A2W5E1Z7_9BURK|nr:MAG: DUF3833 domain-containing protein [Roseateles depolymerans]
MNSSVGLSRRSLALLLGAALTGCAGPQVQDYAQQQPRLDLRDYFNGRLTAHGMFTDRSGRVIKRFTVALTGTWQGDVGTLDEQFQYSDGTTERRVWRLRHLGEGRYAGQADDVIGTAEGESAGNALRWRYTLALPVDGRVWQVSMDDWMFLMDGRTLLNRTAMSKFGVHLGDVTLAFRKD